MPEPESSLLTVLLNTRPLLFVKTGVGYYVSNLYEELSRYPGLLVRPTVDPEVTGRLKHIGSVSRQVKRIVGDRMSALATPLYNFLVSRTGGRGGHAGADIYHETQYDPIPTDALKSVANVYDLSFVLCPQYLPEAVARKFRLNMRNALLADRIIVNTEAVKAELQSLGGVDGDRVDVIPLAPAGNYRALADKRAARERLGRLIRREYVLFVGTIEPRKNIPVLLKAFKILRERCPVALVLAGGRGWLCDDILEMPRRLGMSDDVVFTGYVDEAELRDLYNCASAVVCPSLYEGFGLPVVEAMAAGTPLIVSDIPSLREVAGDAALVFEPGNVEELASGLQQLLSSGSLQDDLREKGLQRSSQYSWEQVAAATVRTYRKALSS